jgi:RNase P/RNase MRP subunit p29
LQWPREPDETSERLVISTGQPRRKIVLKKASVLRVKDMTEIKPRLGERALSEAQLKLVTGGMETIGGTCTQCNDTDC